MSNMPGDPNDTPREVRPRRHVAGMVALVALAVVVVAWFWTARQGPETGLGLSHGVIFVGAGTFLAALMVEIRNMSLSDVLEMIWDLIVGLFWLTGAILKGIWNFICGLFGWN
jgi:hypothetical protein